MRREELYLADLIDNARAVRGYLDGVTRARPFLTNSVISGRSESAPPSWRASRTTSQR
jgi:hypothetical protein